jgi:glycine reductase
VTNLLNVARTMHVNRVFPGVAIPHILGNPTLPGAEERALRRALTERALSLLTQPAAEATEASHV